MTAEPLIYTAVGTHGDFTFNAEGTVLRVTPCDPDCDLCGGVGYTDIARVDVAASILHDGDEVDILDVAYWKTDGTYVPAVPESERRV